MRSSLHHTQILGLPYSYPCIARRSDIDFHNVGCPKVVSLYKTWPSLMCANS